MRLRWKCGGSTHRVRGVLHGHGHGRAEHGLQTRDVALGAVRHKHLIRLDVGALGVERLGNGLAQRRLARLRAVPVCLFNDSAKDETR